MKKIWLALLLFCSGTVSAKEERISIENIADILYGGVDWATHFIHIICVVIGLMLLIMAISFYKMHRQNPKYVPLDRPVAYLILGLILMSIPIWNQIFGKTGSTIDMKKKEVVKRRIQDIDAPIATDPNGIKKRKTNPLKKDKIIYDIDAPLDWADDFGH